MFSAPLISENLLVQRRPLTPFLPHSLQPSESAAVVSALCSLVFPWFAFFPSLSSFSRNPKLWLHGQTSTSPGLEPVSKGEGSQMGSEGGTEIRVKRLNCPWPGTDESSTGSPSQ